MRRGSPSRRLVMRVVLYAAGAAASQAGWSRQLEATVVMFATFLALGLAVVSGETLDASLTSLRPAAAPAWQLR